MSGWIWGSRWWASSSNIIQCGVHNGESDGPLHPLLDGTHVPEPEALHRWQNLEWGGEELSPFSHVAWTKVFNCQMLSNYFSTIKDNMTSKFKEKNWSELLVADCVGLWISRLKTTDSHALMLNYYEFSSFSSTLPLPTIPRKSWLSNIPRDIWDWYQLLAGSRIIPFLNYLLTRSIMIALFIMFVSLLVCSSMYKLKTSYCLSKLFGIELCHNSV